MNLPQIVGTILTLFGSHYMQLDPVQVDCLAQNIYFEARGEPIEGMVAVGMVTLNRVTNSPRPRSFCDVVLAPHQFSWTSDPSSQVEDQLAYEFSVRIAAQIIAGDLRLPGIKADHYVNRKKKRPKWARHYRFTRRIGNHWFYASR